LLAIASARPLDIMLSGLLRFWKESAMRIEFDSSTLGTGPAGLEIGVTGYKAGVEPALP
jgi:hypothetical protein